VRTPLPRPSGGGPYHLTFVCLANVCTSPMADAVMRKLLAESGLARHVESDSAGTGGWHVAQGADRRAVTALSRRGYRTAHRSQQLQRADFATRDLIVAMDEDAARDLRRLTDSAQATKVHVLRSFDPAASGDLNIPDPYYGSDADFERALDLVEAGCYGLLSALRDLLTSTGALRPTGRPV
jgi:protein-tyrosine phosphatase